MTAPPASPSAISATAVVQGALIRWKQGDEAARQELFAAAYERLRKLAAVILNESFPRLKEAPALLQTTEVAHEAALGLHQMLSELTPDTPRDFFRLAAQRIRWWLMDRAKQSDRTRKELAAVAVAEAHVRPSDDEGPAVLAHLYHQIDELPVAEREVVDLLYFHGLTQTEVANVLAITERTVRRHWAAARVKLAAGLTPPN